MFRQFLFIAFVATAVASSDRGLSACGDKFLVLGRSVGYQSLLKASKPGTIVLYTTPNLPTPFGNGRFGVLMDAAGHRMSTVSDRRSLERALAAGNVDLVLADATVSREVGGYVNGSSTALVVPILNSVGASERATFEKEFGCILRLPADPRGVIDALDKAMKLRAKRAAAHTA